MKISKIRAPALGGLIAISVLVGMGGSTVFALPDPCDILDSEDRLLLSGAAETALMYQCGEMPAPGFSEGATGTGTTLPPGAFGIDTRTNAIPDVGSSTQSEVSMDMTGGMLVAGWNDSTDFAALNSFNGYGVSTDGGATWTDRGALLPLAGVTSGVFGDPWIRAHHGTGNFYYSSLANDTSAPVKSIIAVYTGATPGTAPDWPAAANVTPGQAAGTFEDKEAMDVDNSGGTYDGRVYVCWRQFNGDDNVKVSVNDTAGVDLPLTHRFIRDMNAVSAMGQGCFVDVNQVNGDVWVAWEDFGTPRTIRGRRSVDGGNTWGTEATLATLANIGHTTTCTLGSCVGRQVMNGDIRVTEFISSMSVSPRTGNLHVVYASDGPGVDEADVFHVSCSPTGVNGITGCTAPFKLNSDTTSTDQFHPYIHAADNGDLATFWYDRRFDPANNMLIDVFKRFSFNDGVDWTPDERVTDVSFGVPPLCPNFDTGVAHCYMAEYNHIISSGSSFYFIWGDNRNLVSDIPNPDIFFEAEQTPPPSRVAPTLGRVALALLVACLAVFAVIRLRRGSSARRIA